MHQKGVEKAPYLRTYYVQSAWPKSTFIGTAERGTRMHFIVTCTYVQLSGCFIDKLSYQKREQMRENTCEACGNRKRMIVFVAFGYEYQMSSNLCQKCWEKQVEKDALRLRAQYGDLRSDVQTEQNKVA